MRRIIMVLATFCAFMHVFADNAKRGNEQELTSQTVKMGKSGMIRPQHAPANVDLLLLIGEDDVTIRFNGDFGTGTYQLTDVNSGYTVSNTVEAYAGSTEVVPFVVDETTNFEFAIEFEDGSWCQLNCN